MGIKKLLFSIICILGFCAAPAHAGPTITIRADNWGPFTGEPKSDRPGVMIDIAKRVFERKGYTIDYQLMPWSRVLKEVGDGVYDGAAGASPDDAPDFLYTKDPQGMWTVACMMKNEKAELDITNLNSLNDLKVGAMLGYVYGATAKGEDIDAYVTAHKDKNVLQLSGDFPLKTAIGMLQRGRLDVVLETPEVFYASIDEMKLDRADFKVAARFRPLSPVWIGFSPKKKESKQYKEILEEGMKWLRESGEFKKILDKYGMTPWEVPK